MCVNECECVSLSVCMLVFVSVFVCVFSVCL